MGDFNAAMANDILRRLGKPQSHDNVIALTAWAQAEGGSARFNAFNTTLPEPGATNYNSVGVKNYPDYETGVRATVSTLEQQNMSMITAALTHGINAYDVANAIEQSPWGTGGGVLAVLHAEGYKPTPTVHPLSKAHGDQGEDHAWWVGHGRYELHMIPESANGQVEGYHWLTGTGWAHDH